MTGRPAVERSVLLLAHDQRPGIRPIIERITDGLARHGVRTDVLPVNGAVAAVEPTCGATPEMVLVLGGDGSFLRAAELARALDLPVLGINTGHVGFLAEVEIDALDDVLGRVAARDFRTENRMTIDVQVHFDGEPRGSGWALNEASVENNQHRGVLEAILEVDGRPVSAYGCDGVLVCTPTGSTAYGFSAGGPVLWPELDAFLVVPNNAHALFARPLVVGPAAVVVVEVEPDGPDAVVRLDGYRSIPAPAGARVEVTRGLRPVSWTRLDETPFSDRLVRKFRLPVQGWRGRPTPKARG